ncbi:MAG: hypothetical protein HYU85_06320 [Chloroflexi bacterium]|nr:hypothetical protein [Chloroflexota bacterium]
MFASLLEGATAISAKKFMAEEMAKLKNGKQREDLFNDIRAQLDEPVDEGDDS